MLKNLEIKGGRKLMEGFVGFGPKNWVVRQDDAGNNRQKIVVVALSKMFTMASLGSLKRRPE